MINIITPCCRSKNLKQIYDSINFDFVSSWFIVYDTSKNRSYQKQFEDHPNIFELECSDKSDVGNAQRNLGLKLIKDGFIYFLDDDNIIHPELYNIIPLLDKNYLYTFNQLRVENGNDEPWVLFNNEGGKILYGNQVVVKKIDIAQYIFHKDMVDNSKFVLDVYFADGIFISEIYEKNKQKHIYINKVAAYYNKIKNEVKEVRKQYYPRIILFRYEKYNEVDGYINEHLDEFKCDIVITSDKNVILNLFDTNYHLLVTYGDEENQYYNDINSVFISRFHRRWIHKKDLLDINEFNNSVSYCYIDNVLRDHSVNRPEFSIFTTCYNSYHKIIRAYDSVKAQTLKDYEWVILDDSPDDDHFLYLRDLFKDDVKVRLYRRGCNSGNIGNVKNEAISLCRGKYILEFDHDDEILPDTLRESAHVFETYKDVGFVYFDFINIYEDGKNSWYSDDISNGYAGYYLQKYKNRWVWVHNTANINNITLRMGLPCLPNHPRIWRRDVLMSKEIDNYSEFLPIADDLDVLLKTALNTKIAKIAKMSYIQYMNNNNNNFSLIRSKEINRLSYFNILPQFFSMYKINDRMKELDAFEDEKYLNFNIWKNIWKRDRNEYTNKYCNLLLNLDFDFQYCILGLDSFGKNIEKIKELYKNKRNDFILLDNKVLNQDLCTILDQHNFFNMKCYSLKDINLEQLENYFHLIYKSTGENFEILI